MAEIERDYPRQVTFTEYEANPYAHGSVMVHYGQTVVHVTACVEEKVPPFLRDKGKGWVSAEYSMLPGSTHKRRARERYRVSGRSAEIQRLIGRSLRSVVDTAKLGERTILLDCDVLVADGGTRTASISGAFVALQLVVERLMAEGILRENPLTGQLAAVSVGIKRLPHGRSIVADLNYEEDSLCETDMTVVMTREGKFVEIQGTAEGDTFSREELSALIECAEKALQRIFDQQDKVLRA